MQNPNFALPTLASSQMAPNVQRYFLIHQAACGIVSSYLEYRGALRVPQPVPTDPVTTVMSSPLPAIHPDELRLIIESVIEGLKTVGSPDNASF
ncbi:MAG TPA: hypothetical protein DEP53_10335 [Bacteroidetes bacterium]|nr:MAG: hypothetical protein A2X66_09695 [Ignavibacteria bacterium GWA2_54_16]HCA80119.1 hypothetical protein [Bacteroidota bacterium]